MGDTIDLAGRRVIMDLVRARLKMSTDTWSENFEKVMTKYKMKAPPSGGSSATPPAPIHTSPYPPVRPYTFVPTPKSALPRPPPRPGIPGFGRNSAPPTPTTRSKLVLKATKRIDANELKCLIHTPLYETMLRNRLMATYSDPDDDPTDISHDLREEMLEFLAENSSGLYMIDNNEDGFLVIWFENDTDQINFSLRFSGE